MDYIPVHRQGSDNDLVDSNFINKQLFMNFWRKRGIRDERTLMDLWRQEVLWKKLGVRQHDIGAGGPGTSGGGGGGYTPPAYCVANFFTTEEHEGTINQGDTVRTSFTAVAGKELSFYVRLTRVGTINSSAVLTIYDTDGSTVLDTHDAIGMQRTSTSDCTIYYTFPSGGTYFVDITANGVGVQTYTYDLIITGGRNPATAYDATHRGLHSQILVESTNRIFILASFDVNSDSYVTVLNATTGALVAQTQIATTAGLYEKIQLTMFYNPTDTSVWVGSRHTDDTAPQYYRLNPTTGAIVETFSVDLTGVTAAILRGVYNPVSNKLYGTYSNNSNKLHVFNCATRLHEPDITVQDYRNTALSFCYDGSGNIFITNADNSLDAPSLIKIDSSDVVTSVSLTDYVTMFDNKISYIDGVIYGSRTVGSDRLFVSINPTTGAITDIFTIGNIHCNSVCWNECTNTLDFITLDFQDTNYFGFCWRFDKASLELESVVLLYDGADPNTDQAFHGQVMFNSKNSRTSYVGNSIQAFF